MGSTGGTWRRIRAMLWLAVLLVGVGLVLHAPSVSAAAVFVQQNYATPQSPQSTVSVSLQLAPKPSVTPMSSSWGGTTLLQTSPR